MTIPERAEPRTDQLRILTACIFDVDGDLLASRHERAWREALVGFGRFTTEMYQAQMAGKPRLAGARAALDALGVQDAAGQAARYAERKQKRLEELTSAGSVTTFPGALRSGQSVRAMGWRMAVAPFSKNADGMMQAALGVARHDDADLLRAADADLVVTSLDDVATDTLACGRLRGRPA